jgi:hypothetical protein
MFSLPFLSRSSPGCGLIFFVANGAAHGGPLQSRGYDDETMLATVTVGLSPPQLLFGLLLVILGKLQLAQYALLPTW